MPSVSVDGLLASFDPRGKDFERLCKWLLENAPEYRSKLKRVWLWDEYPDRWGADAGIDLVAETSEGERWAVQAKHYAHQYAVKKADIDSFLTESSRSEFSYRLLIATTDHVGPTARRTLAAQEKPTGMLLRSQLEALEVSWPTSITRLRPATPKRKKPRPHQRRAIRDCVEGLASSDRGQLVMACGTGKTLVGPFLAEAIAAKRVLVLVPSLSLLGQTLREWATATDFDYLAVCSDDTVTKDEQDAVVASTSELGVPVTTDATRIARFLRRRGSRTKVIFSTYQSSPQIAAAQANRVPAFDLVIADEAHRCAGPQAGVFATVLDHKKIRARKRLFMTATPRYFTGRVKKEAKEADWEVASMDEEAKFGAVLHRLTFAQAIDRDLLSDYQVVVVGVSDSEAHDLAVRGAFVTPDGETVADARTLARQIGLLRSMAKYDLHRVVTFHSRIDNASRFASSLLDTNEWLPARRRLSGSLWTDHVSGKLTAGERDVRLRRLRAVDKDERGVLTNARCLTEGVDVPTLDGVAFIDPRRSQVDIVQAVGRAIRDAPGKSVGTVVIPVFVDEKADPEVVLASSEFDRVWQVVKALRDHDEDLAGTLDTLRREQGRRGTVGERPSKIVLDLPIGVGGTFARAFDALLVAKTTLNWEEGVGAASRYRVAHGHLRVPWNYATETGFPLGGWITQRRKEHNTGRLRAERITELNALGMVWDAWEENWQTGLAAAREYRTKHGHLHVSLGFVADDGYPLHNWITSRRNEKRRGVLSAERIAALDALDMVWDARSENWQTGVAAARAYREAHGHLLAPADFVTDDGYPLGVWITSRRVERKSGRLAVQRVTELDALGMVWDAVEENWKIGIAAARAYRAAHGHLRVPDRFITDDGYLLGTWISNRRTERSKGRLPVARIAELDALDMVWDAHEELWQRGIAAAREYREANGHLRVPKNLVTDGGFRLGSWISNRRVYRSTGRLPTERIAELDALDMVWDISEEGWQTGLAEAHAYRATHGHLRVPQTFVSEDGYRLGTWIAMRRRQRSRNLLSAARVAQLDALGMVWDARKKTDS